jgi:hypothetical protein
MRTLATLLLFSTLAIAQNPTPVLVELFTSEGCSSCPPADQLLIQLERKQPVPGADVIVLGEHVDYWDGQVWHDRFSSHQLTERQVAYAQRFHIDGPYTPQMVVNGEWEFVGNDAAKALRTIQQAARQAKPGASISLAPAAGKIHVSVSNAGKHRLDVFYAITESGLSTSVGGGENKGRQLHHTAVVRLLKRLGATRDGSFQADLPLTFAEGWNVANLSAVVFLQDGSAGPVFSANEVPLK